MIYLEEQGYLNTYFISSFVVSSGVFFYFILFSGNNSMTVSPSWMLQADDTPPAWMYSGQGCQLQPDLRGM